MKSGDVKPGLKYRTVLQQPGFKKRRETIVTVIAHGNILGKNEAQFAVVYPAAASATGLGMSFVSARSLKPLKKED